MDYVSNLVYKDGTLNRILVVGGYIDMTGGTPAYRFYVTDHQRNVRLVTDATGTALQVNHYDPFGNELDMTASTSPVGGSAVLSGSAALNPYKYGGKEWDEQASLYDFSARMYNPTIARFTTMDPLCEKYYGISPYAYCAGNPVNLVDPSGKVTGDFFSYWGNYVGNDGLDDGKLYLVDDLTITNYEKIDQRYASFEEIFAALHTNADEVDGIIVIERVEENDEHTQGEFFTIGEYSFAGYTMERPGPPTTVPLLKKPIPEGYYSTSPLSSDFAGGFAFWVFNAEVSKTRKIYGHVGNSPQDSSGCILFGMGIGDMNASITGSRRAMENFRRFYSGKKSVKLIIR